MKRPAPFAALASSAYGDGLVASESEMACCLAQTEAEDVPAAPSAPGTNLTIRRASPADLDFIVALECECFAAHRKSSRASIRKSIQSPRQWVFVAEIADGQQDGREPAAAAIVFLYKKSLRLYSIAVGQQYRRLGVGDALMHSLADTAVKHDFESITLEADAGNAGLVAWYRKHGFEVSRFLEDYYRVGESAYRMTRSIRGRNENSGRLVIVTDDRNLLLSSVTDIAVYSARDYLTEARFSNSSHYHVLNFCNSFKTHAMGYYISLLASARNHRVTPTVMTMKDSSNLAIAQSLLDEIKEFVAEKLSGVDDGVLDITVILGRTVKPQFSALGRKLFTLFEMPFFRLNLEKKGVWRVKKITVLNIRQVLEQWPEVLRDALESYRQKKRYKKTRLRNYKYDLAILVNENEKMPPSCNLALRHFHKAAEQVGFLVEFITRADQRRICEFDALFIRETTAIDNHTYTMARHAYTEGLVVIDDPWSILHCSNKVYLHERLAGAGVRQPKGWLLTRSNMSHAFFASLTYPLVLKLPESSFSLGVFRVDNLNEMKSVSRQLLAASDLVIVQEFLDSPYDWRIGVMDKSPLFACKYHMAAGHWQIYNWTSEQETHFSGQHESVPINQVPPHILKTAIKAASLIGDGLYGVDLKEIGQKAYVIEVNDNPNIDAGIEDALDGSDLYVRIMNSIFNRIEVNRQQVRYLS